jgi:hypothetical protein
MDRGMANGVVGRHLNLPVSFLNHARATAQHSLSSSVFFTDLSNNHERMFKVGI